jgi:hypothetical protein
MDNKHLRNLQIFSHILQAVFPLDNVFYWTKVLNFDKALVAHTYNSNYLGG